ncbi:MAG: TldD/PmbA family protein [Deltaproteobacteria bacterium]
MLDTDKSRAVQRVMGQELRRSMKGLKLAGHPKPFFMSYLLHWTRGMDVWGRYGAVFNAEPIEACELYSEIRVGSYRLDQTVDGSLTTDLYDRESYNWLVGPKDVDPEAVRYAFWKLTQLKYWEALHDYYDKKKILVEQRLKAEAPSFSKEDKLVRNRPLEAPKFSQKRWEDFVARASGLFKRYKNLVDPYVRIRGATRCRVFVNSEGSKFIAQENYYEVIINAWYLTKDGVYLHSARYFQATDPKQLPKLREVERAIDEIHEDLLSLAKAEPMEPYAGPALMSGLATGLVFHEAIGHRLEGERMISRAEGQTFAEKVGKKILPDGVDLIDDPTLATWEGKPLFGHYEVDDEGVAARPVELVKDGVLQTFLMSRACAKGIKRSNGHGRHERFQDPMARMANLVVKSDQRHSWDELKDKLLEAVTKKNLPHGIIVKRVSSGETRTDHYDFQAFKGVPTEVYRVDPKTGREERVRNVNFIGTPLAAIQRIRAFGRDYEVDNSYCYAESGSVPVSTVAPSMLVDELELQRATTRYYRPPVLPLPPMKGPR